MSKTFTSTTTQIGPMRPDPAIQNPDVASTPVDTNDGMESCLHPALRAYAASWRRPRPPSTGANRPAAF